MPPRLFLKGEAMKKIVLLIAALSAGIVCAGGLNTYDGLSYVSILAPVVQTNTASAATTNAAVDVHNYKGQATLVYAMSEGEAASYTGVVAVQTCATTNGTWAAVSGYTVTNTGITSAMTTKKIDIGSQKKYLRAVFTSENAAGAAACVLVTY